MAGPRNSHGKRSHSQSDRNDQGRNKRRSTGDDRGRNAIGSDDTVYRYLCPIKKIGSIMGRGGEIVKQLRTETKAKIRIGETVNGSDERVVQIHSTSDETNECDDGDGVRICPAMDAVFKVHDRVVNDDLSADEDPDETKHVSVRLLVPADQIGCVIGKGGAVVAGIRTDTGAQIRILKDNHIPTCALATDELVQDDLPKVAEDDDEMITGELDLAKDALLQVTSRLRANLFEREGAAMSTFLPYLPVAPDVHDVPNYDSRRSKKVMVEYTLFWCKYYSHLGLTTPMKDNGAMGMPYRQAHFSQGHSSGDPYGAYGNYSAGRSGGSGRFSDANRMETSLSNRLELCEGFPTSSALGDQGITPLLGEGIIIIELCVCSKPSLSRVNLVSFPFPIKQPQLRT
ncbi:KH domain-containing protein HEN4-like protein [Tanacetum coccineum]